LAVRVSDQHAEQVALHCTAGAGRGAGDRPAEFICGHWPHRDLGILRSRDQTLVLGAVGVEICAHPEHRPASRTHRRSGDQQVDERCSFVAICAQSSCMNAKRFHDPDPMAAMSAFDLVSPTVTSGEIATAVADVACKRDTRLVIVWQDVESAIQRAAIGSHHTDLRDIAERNNYLRERFAETINTGDTRFYS
jgi:hypothetical protein